MVEIILEIVGINQQFLKYFKNTQKNYETFYFIFCGFQTRLSQANNFKLKFSVKFEGFRKIRAKFIELAYLFKQKPTSAKPSLYEGYKVWVVIAFADNREKRCINILLHFR